MRIQYRLLGAIGCSLLAGIGCGASPVPSGEAAPVPETRVVETEAELAERMEREGEILQAALDAEYTREEQEAMIAEMERQSRVDFTGALSAEETRAIHAHFASQGISAERITFAGRMVSVDQSDAYYHADALLDETQSPIRDTEKAYLLGNILTESNAYGSPAAAPEIYARISGGNTQFWRPALSREDFAGVRRKYFLVIDQPNPAMPAHVRQALVDAAASVEAANTNSNDCLIPNTFEVVSESTWNGFSNGNKAYHYRIVVRYRPVSDGEPLPACTTLGAIACAAFPRQLSKSYAFPPNASSALRMSFGSYLGIPSNGILLNPNMSALDRKEMLEHELGHIIGLKHPFNAAGSVRIHVPGTDTRSADVNNPGDYESFMDYDNEDILNGLPISDDDRLSLRKLYPANGCGYTHGFTTIQ